MKFHTYTFLKRFDVLEKQFGVWEKAFSGISQSVNKSVVLKLLFLDEKIIDRLTDSTCKKFYT